MFEVQLSLLPGLAKSANVVADPSNQWVQQIMNRLVFLTLLVGLGTQIPPVSADWWSDNGDTANAQDIDAGAQSETTTDNDLVRDAQGPGQPQVDPSTGSPVMYNGGGNAYYYGMPYGWAPRFGYGYGYGYMQTLKESGFGQ